MALVTIDAPFVITTPTGPFELNDTFDEFVNTTPSNATEDAIPPSLPMNFSVPLFFMRVPLRNTASAA